MNVCHVITRLIVGGAQENTLLTCAGLHDRGHRVALITGPTTGREGTLESEARASGYEVIVLPSLVRKVHPLQDRRAWRDLTHEFHRLRPEVVHTHSSKAGILGRLAARGARVPAIVHTIHGMSFNRTQPWLVRRLFRRLERYCARFTDQFVSVADAMTAQAVAEGLAGPEKFATIYSGMQTEWFSPGKHDRQAARRSWGFGSDAIVVGTVARLFHNKGYEQLIPAMVVAAHARPELRFVWVGDGAQRAEYEQQLKTVGLRSRVHLTGRVEPSEVPAVLGGLDMLVHASQWEGLPRTAVQALLMECPVISFDIDGAPEVVVPDQTGMLIRLNDTRGLAEAIVELVQDSGRRRAFGKAGRALCLNRFDHRVMVDAIEGVYKKLADRDR